jgi:hypothetical protein
MMFILLAITFIFSCKSVEKMVSRGDYEAAFDFGTSKLRDHKNHKRENIVAYERAYNLLKERDLDRINLIKSTPHDHRWDEILNLYINLDRRERMVASVLPLRTKEGYAARISTTNYNSYIADAKKSKAAYDYNNAIKLLSRARKGNIDDARNAYDLLKEVKRYDPYFAEIEDKLDESYHLGLEMVGIDFESAVGGISNDLIKRRVLDLDPARWNTFWKKYEFVDKRNNDKMYNTIMIIKIDDVHFGSEKEFVNNYDKVKTITDGERVVYDRNGEAFRDTAGHKITEPNTIEVRAIVTEARREKRSSLIGRLSIYDNINRLPIRSIPISVDYLFEDVAMKIVGDKRALDDMKIRRLDGVLANFPDNVYTINALSTSFYSEIEKIISRFS